MARTNKKRGAPSILKYKEPSAYSIASANGWLERIYKDLNISFSTGGKKISDDDIFKKAQQFKTLSEWRRRDKNSMSAAMNRGKVFYDYCCKHMSRNIFWTDEMLIKEALKYKTRGEWKSGNKKSYMTAHNRGLIEKCALHMKNLRKIWDTASVLADIRNYKRITTWRKSSPSAFKAAKRLNIIKKIENYYKITK